MAGKGFRYTIGSRAVAVAIMTEVLQHAEHVADVKYGKADTSQIAEELVRLAWDVEYKPTAERLVLTLNAGIEYNPRRGAPEDQPPSAPLPNPITPRPVRDNPQA